MSRSVLEDEIGRRISATRANLAAHDRGVVLGFLLSLVPIFPVPLVGLALGLFHARAHRAGKLSDFDFRLSQRGLLLAAVNIVLSALLVVIVVQVAGSTDWGSALSYVPRHVLAMLRWLLQLSTPSHGGTSA